VLAQGNVWTAQVEQRVNRSRTDYRWNGEKYLPATPQPPLVEFSVFVTNLNQRVTVEFPAQANANALTNRLNAEVLSTLAQRGTPTAGKQLKWISAR